ncbi:MAG: ABC transporter permease [Candidatus Magasanikbacteria bacterium]|nr:ABC transporter permease [Candidatus Magasanikbacteria bacterium]
MNSFFPGQFTALELAYGALKRQRRRATLTMLAIAIGIAAVITISTAGRGLKSYVLGQLDAFGPDTIYIETHVPHGKGAASAVGTLGITVTTMKERDLDLVLAHPNIISAYGMISGQETISYAGQIKKVMLMGHGSQMPEVESFAMLAGRFYNESEEESLAAVVVLGSKAKTKLFGADTALHKIIYIRGQAFRVVGTMAPRGQVFFFDYDNVVFVPAKTMQKKLLGINYYQAMAARLKDGARGEQTAAELRELLRLEHDIQTTGNNQDDFAINTTADAKATLATVTGGITLLLIALVCISLLVGGVGIMNIMYVSVAERTFEIGLRKALGATSRDILWQFLSEAVLVTLGGGLSGIILGSLFGFLIYLIAITQGFKWIYSVPPSSIFLSVAFSALIGLIFGLYPAKTAAALNPIDALRKE